MGRRAIDHLKPVLYVLSMTAHCIQGDGKREAGAEARVVFGDA